MRGKSFGGSRLTALIVALILAAAGALVNWMQPSKPDQDAGRPPAAGKPGRSRAPLAGGIPKGSYTLTGTVVNVADGDTVTLRRRTASAASAWTASTRPRKAMARTSPASPMPRPRASTWRSWWPARP